MGKLVKEKDTLAFPICVEPNGPQPLDNRSIVETFADLTNGTLSSDAVYDGMQVIVQEEHNIYILTDEANPTLTASWKKVGDNSTVTADLAQVKKDVAANTAAIAKEVGDRQSAITSAIGLLDETVEKSDKGVAVKIVETDGKLDPNSSLLTVTPGTIGGATDGNVVTGTVVKTYVDDQIKTAVASTYKVKGCVAKLSDLDKITEKAYGDVYNVQEAFNLASKPYPAGTNVVWAPAESNGDTGHTIDHWDALGGTYDLSIYKEKQSDVSVTGNVSKTITALLQDANGKITAKAEYIQIESRQVTDLDDDLIDLSTRITTAQNTADTAKTKADTAKTAADAAQATANAAKLTADGAVQLEPIDHTGDPIINTGNIHLAGVEADENNAKSIEPKITLLGLNADTTTILPDRITIGSNGTETDYGIVLYNDKGASNTSPVLKIEHEDGGDFIKVKVGYPTEDDDATTKKYVDEKVDGALQPDDISGATRPYVSTDITNVAGKIVIGATPSVSTDIANVATGDLMLADAKAVKDYVANKISAAALTWEVI